MKKQYAKMSVSYEALALNEAISAGCTLNLLGLGLACDNCSHSDLYHQWDVYYKDNDNSGSFSLGDSYYAISRPKNWNTMSAQCKIVMNATEGTVWEAPFATGDVAANGNVGLILVPSAGTYAAHQVDASAVYGSVGSSTIAYNQTS